MKEKRRGLVSTILISYVGSAVAGFLWIGRPRLAALTFLSVVLGIALILFVGFPIVDIPNLDIWITVGLSPLQVVLVLIVRQFMPPGKKVMPWYLALLIGGGGLMLSAIVVRVFILQPFSTPSGSMSPTLVDGDLFFASKYSYGYSRYSFPFAPPLFDGRIFARKPERGDVLVFKFPPNPSIDYVKRIVGFPGERIQMIDGVLYINGNPIVSETVGTEANATMTGMSKPVTIRRETLPNGISYLTWDITPDGITDNTKEFVVPEGHFFALGDNRDNSNDSRLDLGFVPFENLVGRAEKIYWNSKGTEYRARRDLRPFRRQ